jgi:gas vesicle protein
MNNTGKILTALAAGVAVGALLGVLFAPDKGSETIDKVADESKRLVEEVKDKFRRGKNKFNEMKEDIEQTVKEKVEEYA